MSSSIRFGYAALSALLALSGCATHAPQEGAPTDWRYLLEQNPRLPPPSDSPEAASEAGWVRVGRYAAMRPGPTEAQRHPLQAVVHLQFPRQVRTVGRAVDYALRRSGYQLTSGVGPLQDRALPEVHRSLGPMTIEQTLKTLAGPAYALRVNERLRTIAFVPVPSESSPATGSPGKRAPSRVAALDRRGPAVSARQYGPVRPGETLFPIATRLSAGTGLSTEQMMLALLRANPDAFGRVRGQPNVNVLRCGVTLTVPAVESSASYSPSPSTAKQEVRRQTRLWRRHPPSGGGCKA